MIGLAKEKVDLYRLELQKTPRSSHSLITDSRSLISELAISNKEKIILHHCRLGHPSFRIIKVLFPSLFKTIDVESLHCEVCELAKHKRIPFSISNKRSNYPFYLIHTDIWGPSISNVLGA